MTSHREESDLKAKFHRSRKMIPRRTGIYCVPSAMSMW